MNWKGDRWGRTGIITGGLLGLCGLLATGCGEDNNSSRAGAGQPPTPAAPALPPKLDVSDDISPSSVTAFHADPRFVVRDRIDLTRDREASMAEQPFSHRSRRWHVFPFAAYGAATYTVNLKTEDAAMASEAGVWVFGPRQGDGSWGTPREVLTSNGEATLAVETAGYGQYAVVVGPKKASSFLPRYPGHRAVVGYDDEDGEYTEEEAWIVPGEAGGGSWLEFRDASGSGAGRYKIINALDAPDYNPELNDGVIFVEWPDGNGGQTEKWFVPQAWSRSTWMISETGEDMRLAFFNEPYEGFVELLDPDAPAQLEGFHLYDAVNAAGARLDVEEADLLSQAAVVTLMPEVHEGQEVQLTRDGACEESTDHHCRIPAYLTDDGLVPVEPEIKLETAYRPLHIDLDEDSLYNLDVKCEGVCAPSPRPTRYPVYLAHGFNSSRLTWVGLVDALAERDEWRNLLAFQDPNDADEDGWRGVTGWVHAESVPGFQPVPWRTEQMRRNLTAWMNHLAAEGVAPPGDTDVMRFNIIAHSMGGLDSRYLVGHQKYNNDQCHTVQMCEDSIYDNGACCADANGEAEACCMTDTDGRPTFWRDRVVSISTLSTPHCGSSFASWGVRQLESSSIDWVFRKVASSVMGLKTESQQELLRGTLYALSNEYCQDVMAHLDLPNPDRVYDWACAQDADCRAGLGADQELPEMMGGAEAPLPGPTSSPTLFSWASTSCVTGSCGDALAVELVLPFRIVAGVEGENDGVVATKSAKFGIFMGIRSNDHFKWTRLKTSTTGRIARWLFGVPDEPVLDWHFDWLERLRDSGY